MKNISLHDIRFSSTLKPDIRRGLASGELIRIAPHIACSAAEFAELPPHHKFRLRCTAASHSARTAVLISKAAAAMHGRWILVGLEEKVELCTPTGRAPARKLWFDSYQYRYCKLAPGTYRVMDGVRVVSRVRACLDIIRYHGFVEGLIAVDSALKQGISKENFKATMAETGQFTHHKQVQRCLELASDLSESPFESLMRALILEDAVLAALPLKLQAHVLPGVRADLLLGKDIVIEIDGASKYDGQTYGKAVDEVLRQERAREKKLTNAGYRVLRFSPRQLLREPTYVLDTIHAAVGERRVA